MNDSHATGPGPADTANAAEDDTTPQEPTGNGARDQAGGQEWEHVRGSGRGRRHHRHGHRKERILHTRISEQLSEDIRAMAEDLRLPVSNLVRNVLEEAFSVVEQVSDDLGGVFDEVLEGAEEASERYRRRQRHGDRGRRRAARRRARDAGWPEAPCAPPPGEPVGSDEPARSAEPTGAAESARSDAPGEAPPPPDLFDGIVAWQPVVLHAPQYCARTGDRLAAGDRAYAAIGSHGLTGLYVREDALPVD